MKRRDENRQQSKEEFEAEFNGDDNGANPGEEGGNWVMAKDDVVKKRKIIKAKRIGGGVNTPFPGFKGGFTNKEVAAPPVPSKPSNPFSGFSGLTGSFSTTPSSDAPRPKPSPIKSSTTAAVAAQAVPAAIIATTSKGSSHSRGYTEAMKQLNKSFSEWVRRQQNENSISTWSKGVKDYIDYVRKLVEKYPEHESENAASTAANGKEEGFSYSPPSLSSNPVATVKPAATTVFGGGSSISASATSFSSAEPNNDGKTTSLFSAAPFTIQAGEGGGGNTYRSTTNGGGTQGDNREVDGDSMAKEKPADLCRAEGEADEEVLRAMRNVKTDSRRLVLRNDIGKVILNVIVYPGMTFDKQKSAVGFVASGEDGSSLVKYSIKVKQVNLEPFMKALEALVPPQK